MLTAGTEGTLYEIAEEVFLDTVMTNDRDWEIYYKTWAWPSSGSTSDIDELIDEIIDKMIDAADRAMTQCALNYKYKYLMELRSHE